MPLTIRPYTAEDYAQIAQVINAVRPYWVTSEAELRYTDETRDPKCNYGLWLAEREGEVLGLTLHTQYADLYDPLVYWVTTYVLPRYQRQGIGTALFEHLLRAIQPLQPTTLKAMLREDQRGGLAFARKLGFAEVSRRWESRLEVAACDLTPYADLEAGLGTVVIKTYAELADNPEREQKLHALQSALEVDVPIGEPITPMEFEQFKLSVLQNPDMLPDGWFIAVDGERYVGMSSLFSVGEGRLDIELTGVVREYRRRGIALALKVRGVQFAQAHGYHTIVVMNDPVNTGMLAINQRLGFTRSATFIKLAREYEQ